MKPTKFVLMRQNRDHARRVANRRVIAELTAQADESRARHEHFVAAARIVSDSISQAAGRAETVAPFMEVYGVRYVEAPETHLCDGCAFCDSMEGCRAARRAAETAFGVECSSREVIYIKTA